MKSCKLSWRKKQIILISKMAGILYGGLRLIVRHDKAFSEPKTIQNIGITAADICLIAMSAYFMQTNVLKTYKARGE